MISRMKTVFALIKSQGAMMSMGSVWGHLPEYSNPEIKEALSALTGAGLLVKIRECGHVFYRPSTPDEMIERIYDNAATMGEFSNEK